MSIQVVIHAQANPTRAKSSKRFFKTGKGEYAEGDIFIGITVPQSRVIAKTYHALPLPEIKKLLNSKIHEERAIALFILVDQFIRGDERLRAQIYRLYIASIKYINNWDLVDVSAPTIVGGFLMDKPKDVLTKLAQSKNLWHRRIAIIATQYFIRKNQYNETLRIAELLLTDTHDLIHKAVGWMLREVGNRSLETEEVFLKKYYKTMPRTMLRYAIEKFSEEKRLQYLKTLI